MCLVTKITLWLPLSLLVASLDVRAVPAVATAGATATSARDLCGDVSFVEVAGFPGGMGLKILDVEDRHELVAHYREYLQNLQLAANNKDAYSGRHQADLVRWINDDSLLQTLAIDSIALELGIHDSDKGKLAAYKKLLTESSAASEFLLNILRGWGDTKSARVIRGILDNEGFRGRTILNPELETDEIRDAFRSAPVLQGFLHDLPGMLDMFLAYERGLLTTDQLRTQLLTNLFHNGPAEGFWGFLTKVLVGQNPTAITLLRNTIYTNNQGQIVYPGPQSAEGVLHTIGDRLSQGTRGGVMKIFFELVDFTPPLKAMKDALVSNPAGTRKQLVLLQEQIATLAEKGTISASQKDTLLEVARIAEHRLRSFQEKVNERIENLDEFRNSESPLVLQIEGQLFTANQTETDQGRLQFARAVEAILRRIESEIGGDPMRPISLP